MIRNGKLIDWVVREVKKHKDTPIITLVPEAESEAPASGDVPRTARESSIHTIFGGPHVGGDTRSAMDRYAREARQPPLTNVFRSSERPPKLFKGEDTQFIFSEEDARWVHHPHSDALVVNVRIGSRNVHRVFVDNGSSVNLLYYSTFQKMGLLDNDMTQRTTYLYGFTDNAFRVKGTIKLPVTLGEDPVSATQVG